MWQLDSLVVEAHSPHPTATFLCSLRRKVQDVRDIYYYTAHLTGHHASQEAYRATLSHPTRDIGFVDPTNTYFHSRLAYLSFDALLLPSKVSKGEGTRHSSRRRSSKFPFPVGVSVGSKAIICNLTFKIYFPFPLLLKREILGISTTRYVPPRITHSLNWPDNGSGFRFSNWPYH